MAVYESLTVDEIRGILSELEKGEVPESVHVCVLPPDNVDNVTDEEDFDDNDLGDVDADINDVLGRLELHVMNEYKDDALGDNGMRDLPDSTVSNTVFILVDNLKWR